MVSEASPVGAVADLQKARAGHSKPSSWNSVGSWRGCLCWSMFGDLAEMGLKDPEHALELAKCPEPSLCQALLLTMQ